MIGLGKEVQMRLNAEETLVVRAPLRVSFGGGGTDLPAYYRRQGGFVLSAAIRRYAYVLVREPADRAIRLGSADYQVTELYEPGQLPPVKPPLELTKAALEMLGYGELRRRGINLFTACEVPPGTGLGSSSSMAVGLIRAISEYLDRSIAAGDLAEAACRLEIEQLDMPIGKQDQYASAFGGLNAIAFLPDNPGDGRDVAVEALDLPASVLGALNERLLLFSTGRSHDSATILRRQGRDSQSSPPVIESLGRIKELAFEMREALEAFELDRFGSLLDASWQQKRGLSKKISSTQIDGWYAAAREAGALGGKITGAGGGGFLLLYCPPASQPRLRAAMDECGLLEMPFEFDFDGARVLSMARRSSFALAT